MKNEEQNPNHRNEVLAQYKVLTMSKHKKCTDKGKFGNETNTSVYSRKVTQLIGPHEKKDREHTCEKLDGRRELVQER